MPTKTINKSIGRQTNSFLTYTGKLYKQKDGGGILVDIEKEQEISVSSKDLANVWHTDTIYIQVDSLGIVHNLEVMSRGITHILGRVSKQNNYWVINPEDNKLPIMYIDNNNLKNFAIQKDDMVYAKIMSYPNSTQKTGIVEIIEIMGEFDNPGIEIDMAVKKYNLPYEFSIEVEKELTKIPNTPAKKDYKDRIDLTDIEFVTIDGEDARDFDDAVYCEPCVINNSKKNNAMRLLVAIADVSHYVKSKTALDAEAINRATSVYFPRKVIPMLPEKLSNGLCSLNPHVDRLCMVCDMIIDAEGKIHAYQFYNAVMHSKARLTYDIVSGIIDTKIKQNKPIISKGDNLNLINNKLSKYTEIIPQISDLYKVFQALLNARHERGAIDFDTQETQIVCGDNGKIEKIIPRNRNDAHRLIEECMLAANVCAADYLQKNHQSLYRIHGEPNPEKLIQLQNYLQGLGIKLTLDKNQKTSTKNIADILRQIQNRTDTKVLQTMILRTMQQAVYDNNNIGHYGLAYKAYTHFTSPIRRYPDLLVHRSIKAILNREIYEPHIPAHIEMHSLPAKNAKSNFKKNVQDNTNNNSNSNKLIKNDKSRQIWHKLGAHSSALERRADEASRDVEAWLKCYFMQSKVGYTYTGFVSAVVPFGLFIQLDDLYVEGLIHVSELGHDYFVYDEARQQMYGKQTKKIYKIGDKLTIKVTKVDIASRKIDFALVQDSTKIQHSIKDENIAYPSKTRTAAAKKVSEDKNKKLKVSNPARNIKKTTKASAKSKHKP